MRKIWAIIRRELIAYFSSPLAYIVMTAFLLMQGYIFYLIVSFLNNPQTPAMTPLRLFFGGTIFFWLFLLFVVPVMINPLFAPWSIENNRSSPGPPNVWLQISSPSSFTFTR